MNASIWRARGTTGWIMGIARKRLTIRHVSGPTGVPGRNSDKALIRTELGREPNMRLQQASQNIRLEPSSFCCKGRAVSMRGRTPEASAGIPNISRRMWMTISSA